MQLSKLVSVLGFVIFFGFDTFSRVRRRSILVSSLVDMFFVVVLRKDYISVNVSWMSSMSQLVQQTGSRLSICAFTLFCVKDWTKKFYKFDFFFRWNFGVSITLFRCNAQGEQGDGNPATDITFLLQDELHMVHGERERGRSLKPRLESRGVQRDHSCTVSVFLYLYLIATRRQLFQFPRRNAVYKAETRLENKTQKQEVAHHPSDRPFWHHYHLPAVCGEISGATVSVCRHFIESLSPLLLSGLWSVLASLFSRWGTVVGSGVGLVLQLFSCFTGDESAMELWLLLSSEPKNKKKT